MAEDREADGGAVELHFTVPAHAGRTFTGMMARRARVLDGKSRTMPVELDVVNGDVRGGAVAAPGEIG